VQKLLADAGIDVDSGPRLEPGSLICEFEVPFRPVPWKAPVVPRTGHAYKDKDLVKWQQRVSDCADAAMLGHYPYSHEVRLEVEFYLTARAGSPPDTSNLTKALEDSLQGYVITNDTKVASIEAERFLGADRDRAWIRVIAVEPPS